MNPNQPLNNLDKLCGAGGTWQVIEEMIDPAVIRQDNQLSCAACAQMLLKDRGVDVPQTVIATQTGIPTDASSLARAGKGTRYKMEREEFLQYWNQQGVYLRRQ